MADKGKQFEWAVVLGCWKRVGMSSLSRDKQVLFQQWDNPNHKDGIKDADVKQAGVDAAAKIASSVSGVDFKTTRQLGGGRTVTAVGQSEPKTDVIIGRNIKISVKWEDKGYQLASGKPEFTYENLKNSLALMYENGDVRLTDYNQIKGLIESYSLAFSGVGTQVSTQIDSILSRNQQLIGQLQLILGGNHDPGSVYEQFNRAVVYEALTGENLFGSRSESTANHVLGNLSGFHKITPEYVNIVAKYFKSRIASKKGRGTTSTGARRNDIAGRLEIVERDVSALISELSRLRH